MSFPNKSPQFSCSVYTLAGGSGEPLHFVPAVGVVEEGDVLVASGPAARRVGPLLSGGRLREHSAEQQVVEREVVVGAGAGTRPAAVLEQDRLVRVVAQPQVSNLQ